MEKIWFHGDDRENPRFRIGHTGRNAHTFGDYESTRYGIFLTDNPEFAKIYGSVKQYRVNVSNTLKLPQGLSVFDDLVDQLANETDVTLASDVWHSLRTILYGSSPKWMLFEGAVGAKVVEFLKMRGYDSVLFQEANTNDEGDDVESNTLVVLDDHKIRQFNDPKQLDLFDEGARMRHLMSLVEDCGCDHDEAERIHMALATAQELVRNLTDLARALPNTQKIAPWVVDKTSRAAADVDAVWGAMVAGMAESAESEAQRVFLADLVAMVRRLAEIVAALREGRVPDPWVQHVLSRAAEHVRGVWAYFGTLVEAKHEPLDKALWARAKAEAKKRYDVYPSAYANGWAAKYYKERGGRWKTLSEDLDHWFNQKWVDISRKTDDGRHPECGASAGTKARGKDGQRAYPKCRPAVSAANMSDAEKRSAVRRKREVENKPGAGGKAPDHVSTRVKESEGERPDWFEAGEPVDMLSPRFADQSDFLEPEEFDLEWRLCRVPAGLLRPFAKESLEAFMRAMEQRGEADEDGRIKEVEAWIVAEGGPEEALKASPLVAIWAEGGLDLLDGHHRNAIIQHRHPARSLWVLVGVATRTNEEVSVDRTTR